MSSDHDPLEVLLRVYTACAGLSMQARLEILELAWLTVASNARTEALIQPGGFPEERTRQVEHLRRMIDLVTVDEPDLELERLYQEGDIDGMLRRAWRLMDPVDGSDTVAEDDEDVDSDEED